MQQPNTSAFVGGDRPTLHNGHRPQRKARQSADDGCDEGVGADGLGEVGVGARLAAGADVHAVGAGGGTALVAACAAGDGAPAMSLRLTPFSSPEFCAPQMVAMRVPRQDPMALKLALWETYRIEIPVFDWQDNTIVRLSTQGYNTQNQMDFLVSALEKEAVFPTA